MPKPSPNPISQADLLALKSLTQNPEELADLALSLGYDYRENSEGKSELGVSSKASLSLKIPANKSTEPDSESAEDRPALNFWYVASYTQNQVGGDVAEQGLEAGANEEGDFTRLPLPAVNSELPEGKLTLWLDQLLSNPEARRDIDVPAVVERMARNQSLRRWPRLAGEFPLQELVVVIDMHAHLYPVISELRGMLARLIDFLGEQACHVVKVSDGGLRYLDKHQLPENSRILLLSDLGAMVGTACQQSWHTCLQSLCAQGHELSVFSPVAVGQAESKLFAHRVSLSGRSKPENVEALVAAMAFCHCAKPEVLRYLRQSLTGANLADELAVWSHKAAYVSAGQWHLCEALHGEYLSAFVNLPDVIRAPLLRAIKRWQRGLQAETVGLGQMLLYQYGLRQTPPNLNLFSKILSYKSVDSAGMEKGDYFLAAALPALQLATSLKNCDDFKPLYARAQTVGLHTGGTLPLGARDSDVNKLWCFFESDGGLHFAEQHRGIANILTGKGQLLLHPSRVMLETLNKSFRLAVTVEGDGFLMTLKPQQKPIWAKRIYRNAEGIHAEHDEGAIFKLIQADATHTKAYWHCQHHPWSWASEVGIDNNYGLWATFTIIKVQHTLRWLPPGEFLMGSPEGEVDRMAAWEKQHSVSLTKGFWLADTTCTQALWQAVMGKNPSHFQSGEDHKQDPVEQVSWHDCQKMIEKVNKILPGIDLGLPSEAQWEYACRAGTTGPYNFGDTVTSDQVNYNGNYPYNDAETGVFRAQTLAVKSLPANTWGFYEMHGNVWEWCSDWYDERYENDSMQNPTGPADGVDRVVRGGSWINGGRGVRSAIRSRNGPDDRDDRTGFRLARG